METLNFLKALGVQHCLYLSDCMAVLSSLLQSIVLVCGVIKNGV